MVAALALTVDVPLFHPPLAIIGLLKRRCVIVESSNVHFADSTSLDHVRGRSLEARSHTSEAQMFLPVLLELDDTSMVLVDRVCATKAGVALPTRISSAFARILLVSSS